MRSIPVSYTHLDVYKRQVYISFNKHPDFTNPDHSQDWTQPQLFFQKPDFTLWYPSLQPLNSPEDVQAKNTCLKLGKKSRFFVKKVKPYQDEYSSEHIVEFDKK